MLGRLACLSTDSRARSCIPITIVLPLPPKPPLSQPTPHFDTLVWDVPCAKTAALEQEVLSVTEVDPLRAFTVAQIDDQNRVPRLKQAAAHLDMSTRTIVRMLGRHGTTFHKLVEDGRKARPIALIGDPSVPLAQVAQALGFSDMSSFGRSFRSWFGDTPGHLRQSGGERPISPG